MKPAARLLVPTLLILTATAARAADSGSFLVRLGQDTPSVERYTRTGNKLEITQVGRSPRTLQRHFVYDFQGDAVTHISVTMTPPGGATPTQTVDATFDADSARTQIVNGTAAPQLVHFAVPRGALALFSSSPWSLYEGRIQQLVKSNSDTLGGPLYYVGNNQLDRFLLRKIGRDSVEITNTHLDVYHAAIQQ